MKIDCVNGVGLMLSALNDKLRSSILGVVVLFAAATAHGTSAIHPDTAMVGVGNSAAAGSSVAASATTGPGALTEMAANGATQGQVNPGGEIQMSGKISTVLVVGATGSIGRLVVEEALREGYNVRALVRNAGRASDLPQQAQRIVGDLTQLETLAPAVQGVDAIVFTHGGDGGNDAENVDYGGVRNVLEALHGRKARIALMTLVGATNPNGYGPAVWKRRSERLVRASGLPYTIVRPGWFDYNAADQLQLVPRQGDTRWSGGPNDGVVSRRQIAQVLVHSLSLPSADHKTFELDSTRGPATTDFDSFFSSLELDPRRSLDGVKDRNNMPLADEPTQVREDLQRITGR